MRVAGFLAGAALTAGFFGEAAGLATAFFADGLAFGGRCRLAAQGLGRRRAGGWTRVGFGDAAAFLAALGLRPRTYFWTLPP